MRALVGKARAVEDQDAATLRQPLQQPTPDPVGIPGRVRDEVLQALVGDRVGHPRLHGLHRLALAVAEQAGHVGPQREPLRTIAEAVLERLEPAHQALQLRGRAANDHRRAA